MEPLGKKLQQARLAKGITLDEAARMTKIRPSRLEEIEAEDFSQFPSLAYAKGFLQIYGKFLDVDVTPYLDAFETSKHMTVDGYSYLQDNPAPAPARAIFRRSTEKRAPILPLVIFGVILVVGFIVLKLILDIQRVAPAHERRSTVAETSPSPSAAPTTPSESILAPRAIPVDSPSAPVAAASPNAAVAPTTVASASPVAVATPAKAQPSPTPSEPEVRRAEPVHPEDLARLRSQSPASATESAVHRVEIRSLKKTYVKVTLDNYDLKPALDRWISPSEGSMQFRGQHIAVKVLDRDAVEIRKNGKPLAEGDADVTIED
jgi:cytoskeletal protein RodZ